MNKKYLTLCLVVLISCLSPLTSWSAESTGKIKKVKVCGSGFTTTNRWNNYLLFQMEDDVWYTIPGNYVSQSIHNRDLDDNLYHSIVMLAYSNQHDVHVSSSNSAATVCGTTSYSLWNSINDHIEIIRPQ